MTPSGEGPDAPAKVVGAFGVLSGSREDQVIQRELVRSMRLRALTMSWVLGIATLNVVVVLGLLPLFGMELLPVGLSRWAVTGLVLALWVPELVLLAMVRHRSPRWTSHPGVELAVGVVEVTAVSGFLWVSSQAVAPAWLSLAGPVPLLYFPLVAISVLTLRPLIVMATGGLAVAQLTFLTVKFVGIAEGAVVLSPELAALGTPSFYLQKVLILVMTTLVAGAVAFDLRRRLRRIATGAREREELVSMFGQHVAPEVVEALISGGGRVTPERRDIGILFLDIRGFTTVSEQTPPEEVVARLDRFFDLVLPKITEHGGIIHQLLGDGFMAIFGAPVQYEDDARRTLRAAIDIHDLILAAIGDGRIENTDVVMGVHFGQVVVGPVGATDHKEYKATGDAVNVAARLEAMAKELDARLLCSRAAAEAAGMEDEAIRDLGEVPIRGRVKPLRVLQLR